MMHIDQKSIGSKSSQTGLARQDMTHVAGILSHWHRRPILRHHSSYGEGALHAGALWRMRLCAAAMVLGLATATPVLANCRGTDLLEQIRTHTPSSYAAIRAEADATPFGRGRLFLVSRGRNAPSYLYGTVHLSDPRLGQLSPRALSALMASKVVFLESIDAMQAGGWPGKTRANARARMLAERNQQPHRLLEPEDFQQLEASVLRRNLPRSAARDLKPIALALLLDLPGCAIPQGNDQPYLDALVGNVARRNAIPLKGLETIEAQLDALDVLPPPVERDLLIAMIHQSRRAEDLVETTIARYVEGDLGGLLSWMRSPEPIPGVAGAQIPAEFLDRLLDFRSRRMRDRLLPALLKGGAFVAVGAAHLPGANGLAKLLQQEGFDVQALE